MKNNLNANKLVIGEKYWILSMPNRHKGDFHQKTECDTSFEESLKYCTLKRSFYKNGCILVFCFYPDVDVDDWYEIDVYLISLFVFKEEDDCIVALYRASQQLLLIDTEKTLDFSPTIKEKIKKSQEKNPHKWIF